MDSPAARRPDGAQNFVHLAPAFPYAFPYPRSPMRLKERPRPSPGLCNRARGGRIDAA